MTQTIVNVFRKYILALQPVFSPLGNNKLLIYSYNIHMIEQNKINELQQQTTCYLNKQLHIINLKKKHTHTQNGNGPFRIFKGAHQFFSLQELFYDCEALLDFLFIFSSQISNI